MRTAFIHTRMVIQGVPSDQIKTINIKNESTSNRGR